MIAIFSDFLSLQFISIYNIYVYIYVWSRLSQSFFCYISRYLCSQIWMNWIRSARSNCKKQSLVCQLGFVTLGRKYSKVWLFFQAITHSLLLSVYGFFFFWSFKKLLWQFLNMYKIIENIVLFFYVWINILYACILCASVIIFPILFYYLNIPLIPDVF